MRGFVVQITVSIHIDVLGLSKKPAKALEQMTNYFLGVFHPSN